jgi:hypothetical protein
VAAEGAEDLAPVGVGLRERAPGFEALLVGVPGAEEVCARALDGGVEVSALLDPRERQAVVLEEPEGRARELVDERIFFAARRRDAAREGLEHLAPESLPQSLPE